MLLYLCTQAVTPFPVSSSVWSQPAVPVLPHYSRTLVLTTLQLVEAAVAAAADLHPPQVTLLSDIFLQVMPRSIHPHLLALQSNQLMVKGRY